MARPAVTLVTNSASLTSAAIRRSSGARAKRLVRRAPTLPLSKPAAARRSAARRRARPRSHQVPQGGRSSFVGHRPRFGHSARPGSVWVSGCPRLCRQLSEQPIRRFPGLRCVQVRSAGGPCSFHDSRQLRGASLGRGVARFPLSPIQPKRTSPISTQIAGEPNIQRRLTL
jgi:hypothetical protein